MLGEECCKRNDESLVNAMYVFYDTAVFSRNFEDVD